MGKWLNRLKLLNALATLPAEPAEGASGGNAGEVGGPSGLSEEESRLLQGLPEEKVRACLKVRDLLDGIIEQGDPNESQIDAVDLIREGTMR